MDKKEWQLQRMYLQTISENAFYHKETLRKGHSSTSKPLPLAWLSLRALDAEPAAAVSTTLLSLPTVFVAGTQLDAGGHPGGRRALDELLTTLLRRHTGRLTVLLGAVVVGVTLTPPIHEGFTLAGLTVVEEATDVGQTAARVGRRHAVGALLTC